MTLYDDTYKYIDLKSKCKELGLSYAGRKVDLIDRLNTHLSVSPSTSNSDDHPNDELHDVEIRSIAEESENESFEIVKETEKRKAIRYDYRMDEEEYNCYEEAKKKIHSEEIWIKDRLRVAKTNTKEIFFCKHSTCKMRLFILFNEENVSVSIWRTVTEHQHEESENPNPKIGINVVTKNQIDTLYQSGVKAPKRLLNSLRDKVDQFKPKKFLTDPNIENPQFVPGIVLPTRAQISNYLNHTLKPKLENGKSNFSYGELADLITKNISVPDDEHMPFVIGHCVKVDIHVPHASIIRVAYSTKRLLTNCMKNSHICSDATYKLMWHNFPVLLCGTTDARRTFHPFSINICSYQTHTEFKFIFESIKNALKEIHNYDYQPNCLIADGADEISNGFAEAFGYSSANDYTRVMCWAHVHRAVEEKTKPIKEEYRSEIRDDIDNLQIMPSTDLFNYAYNLFKKKWTAKKCAEVDCFLDYFTKEWVVSNNGKWYEGAADRIPSTDNGLEAVNGSIKHTYTLRERLSVNSYIANLTNMVTNWSKDTLTEKNYQEEYKVTKETWQFAVDCLRHKPVIKKFGLTDGFILCKQEDKNFINSDLLSNRLNKLSFDFNALIEHIKKVRYVKLNREFWTKSICSCGYYMKNYFCYHIITIAVNEKLAEIPVQFIKIPIQPKRKPGRKKKAQSAFVKQS